MTGVGENGDAARPELTLEASYDEEGTNWTPLVFKYKPGTTDVAPKFVRLTSLDWTGRCGSATALQRKTPGSPAFADACCAGHGGVGFVGGRFGRRGRASQIHPIVAARVRFRGEGRGDRRGLVDCLGGGGGIFCHAPRLITRASKNVSGGSWVGF